MMIRFTKMHGIGNDFILISLFQEPALNYQKVVSAWCDRHFGIGADGLILIQPPIDQQNQLRMTLYNSDGSEADMSGNGIRCFARCAYEQGLVTENEFRVETLAGIIVPKLQIEDNQVVGVSVNMGKPRFKPEEIPINLPGEEIIDQPVRFGDAEYKITTVSMGNPHCIIFVEDIDRFPVEKIGSMIEKDPLFPKKVNVEFVEVINRHEVKMRVWERGVGITLACGTGACAVAVACVKNNLTNTDLTVHLVGGDLLVNWEVEQSVYLTGPSTSVYSGEIEYLNP